MKKIIANFLFMMIVTHLTSACLAQTPSILLDNVVEDYVQHMSTDWNDYKLTHYFSKAKPDYHYLAETFEQSIVSDATNIESNLINVSETSDSEGGYELHLLKITYPDTQISSANYSKIVGSPNKNLKGGKIFMGYVAKLCKKEIIFIASPAVLTDKIKSYFSHFKETVDLCKQ